ncbi:MAG: LysM peptidoglycan-binding domain-containing protein [bacterium]
MAVEKAEIINTVTNEMIQVMFNPEEYSISSGARYKYGTSKGKKGYVKKEYLHGLVETLSMELFFDTYEKREDVRNYTRKILKLLEPVGVKNEPPVCLFAWGDWTFEGQLENLSTRYTMFDSRGRPVRATLSVTFRPYEDPKVTEMQDSHAQGDKSDTYRVRDGDTLQYISWKHYGDPGKWRKISKANNIDNPDKLKIGRILTIPPPN